MNPLSNMIWVGIVFTIKYVILKSKFELSEINDVSLGIPIDNILPLYKDGSEYLLPYSKLGTVCKVKSLYNIHMYKYPYDIAPYCIKPWMCSKRFYTKWGLNRYLRRYPELAL